MVEVSSYFRTVPKPVCGVIFETKAICDEATIILTWLNFEFEFYDELVLIVSIRIVSVKRGAALFSVNELNFTRV